VSQACYAKPPLAMHIAPHLLRAKRRSPRDARAYIRPLGSVHCPTPAPQKTQKEAEPEGRHAVHPTPWQRTLPHACHAKEAEPEGVHPTPWQCTLPRLPRKRGRARGTRRTSDPLAVHIVPLLPRKRYGARGTPGRTSDPLAAHIFPRLPRKRRGARGMPHRASDPW